MMWPHTARCWTTRQAFRNVSYCTNVMSVASFIHESPAHWIYRRLLANVRSDPSLRERLRCFRGDGAGVAAGVEMGAAVGAGETISGGGVSGQVSPAFHSHSLQLPKIESIGRSLVGFMCAQSSACASFISTCAAANHMSELLWRSSKDLRLGQLNWNKFQLDKRTNSHRACDCSGVTPLRSGHDFEWRNKNVNQKTWAL